MEQITNSFDSTEQDNQWHFEQGRREERKALLALIDQEKEKHDPFGATWQALVNIKTLIQNAKEIT